MGRVSKSKSSTSMTHVACVFEVIRGQETGWQSGVRSCIMPGLPTRKVQELNVGTVLALRTLGLKNKLFVSCNGPKKIG